MTDGRKTTVRIKSIDAILVISILETNSVSAWGAHSLVERRHFLSLIRANMVVLNVYLERRAESKGRI
jgi:hypothetical protein